MVTRLGGERSRDGVRVIRRVMRAVMARVAGEGGAGGTSAAGLPAWADALLADAVGHGVEPESLGDAYEAAMDVAKGHGGGPVGAFYTPRWLVEHLVDSALTPLLKGADAEAILRIRVMDPACGAGHFLLEAARRLARALARAGGLSERTALKTVTARCVMGVDRDDLAVELARAALGHQAGVPAGTLEGRVRAGDALVGVIDAGDLGPGSARLTRTGCDRWVKTFFSRGRTGGAFHWPLEFPEVLGAGAEVRGFDAVVGNPPFLNQLESASAHTRGLAALLAARTGGAIKGYADTSSAFLLTALRLVRPGGRVALVMPQSFLSSRDGAPVRAAALQRAALTGLWWSRRRVFRRASVFTCAPTFEVGVKARSEVVRRREPDLAEVASVRVDRAALGRESTWSRLIAEPEDLPEIRVLSGRVLGDIATATADFRDQYYALRGRLVEDAALTAAQRRSGAFPPVVTTGLIDLAQNVWGRGPTRIHKRVWAAPRVDRAGLEERPADAAWLRARLTPKVLLATQTRVLEVVADPLGRLLPCTPVISLMPRDGGSVWRLAAAVCSPVCTLIARRTYAGAALSTDAIKLSAKQALVLPAPTDDLAWKAGAEAFREAQTAEGQAQRRAALERYGAEMAGAYGLPASAAARVLKWWSARLGKARGQRRIASRS